MERQLAMGKSRKDGARAAAAGRSLSTSTSLIRRLKADDEQAWQRLLELYVPLVFSWCRRCGMQSEDCADVVQEVFRAVMRGIGSFRYSEPDDTFRGWLRTITQNKVRDHFRAQEGHPVAAGGSTAQQRFLAVAAGGDGGAISEATGLSALVHRALHLIQAEFEDRTWQAFWLAAVGQNSSGDVARQLHMTPGAVRQAKYKVLRRLRQELGDTVL